MASALAPALSLAQRRAEQRARGDFAECARRHLDGVYGYVYGLVRDANVAEDLTASAFEKALRAWESYDPRRAQPQTWLCTIARNVVVDHWRSERRRRDGREALAADANGSVPPPAPRGLDPALEAALDRLTPLEREVVALRVLLDMSCDEAAKVMGISPTACSTYLHRVLGKLRRELRAERAPTPAGGGA